MLILRAKNGRNGDVIPVMRGKRRTAERPGDFSGGKNGERFEEFENTGNSFDVDLSGGRGSRMFVFHAFETP